jgi:uncharacterized delta-60 repeat protein
MVTAALTLALSAGVAPASATTPGWIDTTYGSGGVTVVPTALFGVTTVDSTGRALVLGAANGAGSGGQVTRLLLGGQPDLSFGPAGTFVMPASSIFYTRVALDAAGRIYVLGGDAAVNSPSHQFVVTRLVNDGSTTTADSTFGTSGTATIALPSGVTATSSAFAVRNDGDVVVSVVTTDATKPGYLAALTPAGILDTTFGPTGSTGIFPLPDKQFVFKLAAAPAPVAPVFTAAAPPATANTGVAYTYTFVATGRPAPTFSVATGALPTGLTLNATTGVLSGTPSAEGVFTFTVKAANGTAPDAVTGSLTITVTKPLVAPTFTAATPPATGVVTVAYRYTFKASGNPAPQFSVASGAIPNGLTLNATTGVLSGTPTTVGDFTFTVKAANGTAPDAVTGPVTIHIASTKSAPAFTAANPPTTAAKTIPYSYTFVASGAPSPTFVKASGTLPPGLVLHTSTGVLSGTPTMLGNFTFTVQAQNGVAPPAVTGSITIHVAAPVSPGFTAASPPTTGRVAVAYTYTFAATGNPLPTFAVASGAIPTGLTLNATTGVLSGTPSAAGDFTFTIKATNGVTPDAVTPSITVHVNAAFAAPVFTASSPPTTALTGTAYSYTFAASGNPAPTFALATGTLPTGLTLNANTGVLSGTPTAAGTFTFTVKATNGVSPDATTASITITVTNPISAPVFTAASPPATATVGVPYSYTFKANGNPAPTFTAIGAVPTGMTLNATTGVLSGTPTTAATYYFRVKADNGINPPAYTGLISIAVARAGAAAAGATEPGAAPAAAAAPGAKASPVAVATAAPDPNNDVVALLANDTTATRTYVLQRYLSNGTLDSTFGTSGSTAPLPAGAIPSAIAEAPDSSYYITGNSGQSVFLAHVLANGTYDSAFGTGGVLVDPAQSCKPTGGQIMFDGTNVYVLAIDNDLALCGASPAILLRFHNAALDPTFGVGGEVRIDSVGAMRVSGPNGGGLQPGGQVLVGLNGAAAPAAASAAVTRVNNAISGPAIESYTQLVDDSHFAAGIVAPNPAAIYVGNVGATADGAGATHVFARGANSHLFEFKQTGGTGGAWAVATDLTAGTTGAPLISTSPKAVFDGTTIQVFALGATGDLVQYRNNGTGGAWTTTDLNTVAGSGAPKVTTIDPEVISGQIHLYAQTVAGDLVEIDNDNVGGHAWNFYDLTISAGGGTTIAGGPAALLIGTTPHVYVRVASNNHLLEFVADHANGHVWNAYDTNAQAPGSPVIAGNPVPVLIGGLPHVYTISGVQGDLVEFVADHLNGNTWNSYDQTAGAGAPKPVGNISVVLIDGTPYGIAQAVPEVWENNVGELTAVVADHRTAPGQAAHVWNVYDVTALSGGPQITGDPTPILNGTTVQVFGQGKASTNATSAAALAPASGADRVPAGSTKFASGWVPATTG